MNGGALDVIGFSDGALSPDDLSVLDLAEPVRVAGISALIPASGGTDAAARLRALQACCASLSRVVPLARATMDRAALAGYMRAHADAILSDLQRLENASEIVVTLSFALHAPDHNAAATGRDWLRRRASDEARKTALQDRAAATLTRLCDAAAPDSPPRIVSRTCLPGGARAGADISLLVARRDIAALADRLVNAAAPLLSGDAQASGAVAGPFPPFSFTSLPPSPRVAS